MSPGTYLFWGQKVKGQGRETKNSAGVGVCTLVSAGFFWLSLVVISVFFSHVDFDHIDLKWFFVVALMCPLKRRHLHRQLADAPRCLP